MVSFEGTIPHGLFLLNGQFSNDFVGPKTGGALTETLSATKDRDKTLERIFLTVLSRYPTQDEKKKFIQCLQENKNSGQAYRDVFWVLLI